MSTPAPSQSPWVRGRAWDSFWMLNALWLVPIAFWLTRSYADPEDSPLDWLYFGLTAMFWIGHRVSSTYLAYCTEAYRPLLRTQPIRFVVVPLLVTAGCFAIFLPSDAAWPWSREERLVVLAIIDYVFVTYHFASQHFGALSLYRMRAGRTTCARTRRIDKLFALGVGGVLVFLADILAGTVAYQDLWEDWVVPDWIVSAQDEIRVGLVIVLAAATAAMLLVELRAQRWSLPRLLYVLGLAMLVAIALRPGRSLFLFVVLWTSQHWIVATGLASQVPAAEPSPARGAFRRLLHEVNVRPWAILLLLTLASVILLPLFEVEGNRLDGTFYGDRLFGSVAAGLRTSSWVPALLALGFSTGFIHYVLDRSVYRMSNVDVRAAARGLLSANRPTCVSQERRTAA
jgi:hypothetical protein